MGLCYESIYVCIMSRIGNAPFGIGPTRTLKFSKMYSMYSYEIGSTLVKTSANLAHESWNSVFLGGNKGTGSSHSFNFLLAL